VSTLLTGLRVGYSVLSRRPFVTLKHTPARLKEVVRSAAHEIKPDAVLVEFHYIYDSVEGLAARRVVDMHNVDHLLYDRFARSPRWNAKKIHGWLQRRFMVDFERKLPGRVDACVTVSEQDCHALKTLSGADNIVVAPNGVDTEYFVPQVASAQRFDLLYLGSMDYYPNVEAGLFLCREVMPRVWARRPETTLAIVGRDPTPAVRACGRDARITVTGSVADVRPYLAGASVFVAPLRVGGGTRLKVLEAAMMAKAIVGTPIGVEGIALEHERHALIADGVDGLVEAVLRLLNDPTLRDQLGQAAHSVVSERYDWSLVAAQVESALSPAQHGNNA
jgi:glycosyltransferase involved in cell wall biosynthesis